MELYQRIKRDLFRLALWVVVIQVAWSFLPALRDDTDGDGRSGLIPRTDARTGCQYLESSGGGLTPRVDRNGKQLCAGETP